MWKRMWKWTKRAGVIVAVLAGLAQVLRFLEESRLVPVWLHVVESVLSPKLLETVVVIFIAMALLVGLLRLTALESRWEQKEKDLDISFKGWLDEKDRAVTNEIERLESVLAPGEEKTAASAALKFAQDVMGSTSPDEQRKRLDAVNELIKRGRELLSDIKTSPQQGSRFMGTWEHDVCAWLKKERATYEEDFMADFAFPGGATTGETLAFRVAARLERLLALKASMMGD